MSRGRDSSGGVVRVPPEDRQTLSELGITKKESSQAQFLLSLPEEIFQSIKSFTMTIAQAKRDKKRRDREKRLARRESEAGWVAGQIEVSRRLDTLSWSHHKEVAALGPAEQNCCSEI